MGAKKDTYKSNEALAVSQLVVRGQPVPTISQSSMMFLSPVATFTLARLTLGLGLFPEAAPHLQTQALPPTGRWPS